MHAVRHQAILFIKIYERVDFFFLILFTVVRAMKLFYSLWLELFYSLWLEQSRIKAGADGAAAPGPLKK